MITKLKHFEFITFHILNGTGIESLHWLFTMWINKWTDVLNYFFINILQELTCLASSKIQS